MKALLREGKRSEGSLGMWKKKKLRKHLIISSLAYPPQRERSAFASFSRALNLLHFMLMTFLSGTPNVPIKVRGLWPQFKKQKVSGEELEWRQFRSWRALGQVQERTRDSNDSLLGTSSFADFLSVGGESWMSCEVWGVRDSSEVLEVMSVPAHMSVGMAVWPK